MNYGQLKTAAYGDAHREDYLSNAALVAQQTAEGEALIAARLESYSLDATINDAVRIGTTSAYALPAKTVLVRHLLNSDGLPLEAVDETSIGLHQTLTTPCEYTVRPAHLAIAGNPAAGTVFTLKYFGLPAALAVDADTNTLMTDYPQLYKEAIQVFIFKRARDYEAAEVAFQSVNSLITEINRKMKKLLGGAKSANPYNVSWRSSY